MENVLSVTAERHFDKMTADLVAATEMESCQLIDAVSEHPHNGAHVSHVSVSRVFADQFRYARRRGEDSILPWQDNSTFEKCIQALQWWKQNLPPTLRLEDRQLPLPQSQGDLTLVLASHLWHAVS